MNKYEPRYSGPNRSGICKCGCKWQDHHLSMVMNQDYIDQTHEGYIPDECLHFGFNEMGRLDEEGKEHCFKYQDSEQPCLTCKAKGFRLKKGKTALGEEFEGCEFCCNEDGVIQW